MCTYFRTIHTELQSETILGLKNDYFLVLLLFIDFLLRLEIFLELIVRPHLFKMSIFACFPVSSSHGSKTKYQDYSWLLLQEEYQCEYR